MSKSKLIPILPVLHVTPVASRRLEERVGKNATQLVPGTEAEKVLGCARLSA